MTNIVFSNNVTTEVYYTAGKTSGGRQRFKKAPFNLVRIGASQYIETVHMEDIAHVDNNAGLSAKDYNTEVVQLGKGGTFIDGFEYLAESHGNAEGGPGLWDNFSLGYL